MIIINGIKYACENCIRGHRATKCTHSKRSLIPVKKQGRPSTTCHHCKSLREEKNINPSGSCNCAKIEKEGGLFDIDETIHDRCFCTMGRECSCHSRRRKANILANHESRKYVTKSGNDPLYTSLLTPSSTIDDTFSEFPTSIKEEETPSCCIPPIENVELNFNPQIKLPDVTDNTTLLDRLIPDCCSSTPTVLDSYTPASIPFPTTTTAVNSVPEKQSNCCNTVSYQTKSVDTSNILNDSFLDKLYNPETLINNFIDSDPHKNLH